MDQIQLESIVGRVEFEIDFRDRVMEWEEPDHCTAIDFRFAKLASIGIYH